MKSILKKSGNRPLICIFSTLKKLFSVNRRTLLYKCCTLAQILPAVNVRLKDIHTEMSIRYYVIRRQSLVYWYKIQQAYAAESKTNTGLIARLIKLPSVALA